MESIASIDFQQAMTITERQMSVAISNIANADTPGYKARAIDFRMALEGAEHALKTTHARHIEASNASSPSLKFRDNPIVRADGNTVDATLERAEVKRSSQSYSMAMTTLTGKTKKLSQIMEGG